MSKGEPIRPFLKWAGSKRSIVSILSSYWCEDFTTYIEPFVGSGSLFFYLRPKRALLADINSDLMFTYRRIKEDPEAIASELDKMPRGKDNYYKIRSSKYPVASSFGRAARFVYLNKLSFNGLYRTNKKGEFNVPYGGEKAGRLPTRETLRQCSEALRGTSLLSGDFSLALEKARAGDFVYLDPPYSVKARRVFAEYDRTCFSERDLRRLRQWLDRLTQRGVVFLLSYAKCMEATLLTKGYKVREITVRRNIAGFSVHRRYAKEWLATNEDLIVGRRDGTPKPR